MENNDAVVCKKARIFWKQLVLVTLTRFGTLVITRSSMLLPQVRFSFIQLCQEVIVKGLNKASSLTSYALSMESQRMSGKLKSPEITILSNWSQTSCRKL